MKNAASILLVATSIVFFAAPMHGQGVPIVGIARVYATPSSSTVPLQSQVVFTVGVDLSNVTGQSSEGSTPAVLANYQITVSFDDSELRFDSAAGGTSTNFTAVPTFTTPSTANETGVVALSASQTSTVQPTGNIVVARLTFTALRSGSATVTASASSLNTPRQAGTFGPATIPSSATSATLTLGSGGSSNAQTFYLPVVGAIPGNLGSFFRTSLDLYNPTAASIGGKVVFHRAGFSGNASDPSLSYSLGPHEVVHYGDVISTILPGANAIGSADVVTSDPAPVGSAAVFNDAGANGTSGLTEDLVSATNALHVGDSAVLFAPSDRTAFRLNIGVRSLETGASLAVTVRNAAGVTIGTTTKTYAATFFEQPSDQQFLGFPLSGGESITINVTAGSAFVYGATTDNRTQDPRMQLGRAVQ